MILRQPSSYLSLLVIGMLIIFMSCATPSAPTGGEGDRKPPRILSVSPEAGEINVSTQRRKIDFTLSEYVDRNSFRQALSIEPLPVGGFDLDWWFKDVSVKFRQKLADSTTYVISLGKDLKDVSGNKISNPFKMAFSTGDKIDEGRISLKLFNFESGESKETGAVFLLPPGESVTSTARYTAEPDTGGTVTFRYLKVGKYRPVFVEDLNRDRAWQENEFGRPLSDSLITVTEDSLGIHSVSYISNPDTVSPLLNGIGLLASNYMRLRLSEQIAWPPENETFSVVDRETGNEINGRVLYQNNKAGAVVFALLDTTTTAESEFVVRDLNLTDKSGNQLKMRDSLFIGSDDPDTISARLISVKPEKWLSVSETIIATYANNVLADSAVIDSLQVIEGREEITKDVDAYTELHQLFITSGSEWNTQTNYEFRIFDPSKLSRFKYNPTLINEDDTGSLELIVTDSLRQMPFKAHILDEREERVIELTQDTTLIEGLAGNRVHLRIYKDTNGDDEWFPGSLQPFKLPEPMYQRKGIRLRPGLVGEVEIRLN